MENPGLIYLNNGGVLDVAVVWTNTGAIAFSQGGRLHGSPVHNTGPLEGSGVINPSVVNESGGTARAAHGLLALNGGLTNQPGGFVEAVAGGTLRVAGSMLNKGVINPQGGVIDLQSNTLTNAGTMTGYGSYRAQSIVNGSRAIFQGGNVNIQATYINAAGATTEVALASASFFGPVTNQTGGVFKNTGSQLTFFEVFFNNGSYISDPATNTFHATLTLGPSGALVGGPGDVFVFSADLLSANPAGVDLPEAALVFEAGPHTFTLAGTARVGLLQLKAGASVFLAGADLLVGIFAADAAQFTTAQTIYYDPAQNPALGGQSYALSGGGWLMAIPEPSTALLTLLGLAGLLFRRRGA
jgi:hypothetical protein